MREIDERSTAGDGVGWLLSAFPSRPAEKNSLESDIRGNVPLPELIARDKASLDLFWLKDKKGTGHLLGAKCLNSWMGDFNSWRSRPRMGCSGRRIPRVRGRNTLVPKQLVGERRCRVLRGSMRRACTAFAEQS
jgi:hypothetical protein